MASGLDAPGAMDCLDSIGFARGFPYMGSVPFAAWSAMRWGSSSSRLGSSR